MFVFALLCGYLAACFCLAACVIRLAYSTITARQISERLWLFTALPLLLAVDLLVVAGELVESCFHSIIDWFEAFSGRQHRRRQRKHYGYFSYGYSPQLREPARRRSRRGVNRKQSRRMRA